MGLTLPLKLFNFPEEILCTYPGKLQTGSNTEKEMTLRCCFQGYSLELRGIWCHKDTTSCIDTTRMGANSHCLTTNIDTVIQDPALHLYLSSLSDFQSLFSGRNILTVNYEGYVRLHNQDEGQLFRRQLLFLFFYGNIKLSCESIINVSPVIYDQYVKAERWLECRFFNKLFP